MRSRLLIIGPYLAIVLGGFYGFHRLEETRKDGREAVCAGFEAFTDSLLTISNPPANEAARQAEQVRLDAFQADLNHRLSPLQCRISIPPLVTR